MTIAQAAAPTIEGPERRPAGVAPLLRLETPSGRPVGWADVALVSDPGDSHELNDDRCLVLTSQDLGAHEPGAHDFMLCVLADGATGSTFSPGHAGGLDGLAHSGTGWSQHAGWRASQLAQAIFVERFLSSSEVDILDRLKEGLRAADRALSDSDEGILSTTLVALYLAADGTAYAASIGDSVLLVLPPRRKTPDARRLQKLGYEDSTAVGSGDTTLSIVDQDQLIEQWWPNKEGGAASTRVEPGTYLVLMSDGMSDNLPAEAIDRLLHRHPLDRATVGLPLHTRQLRLQTQKREGGSTQHLGLDNMSAIVVRFDGQRRGRHPSSSQPTEDAYLVSVLGTHGGPWTGAGGQFGVICLAGKDHGSSVAPGFLRSFIESEHRGAVQDRLGAAFFKTLPTSAQEARFVALAVDDDGVCHTFSTGGAHVSSTR